MTGSKHCPNCCVKEIEEEIILHQRFTVNDSPFGKSDYVIFVDGNNQPVDKPIYRMRKRLIYTCTKNSKLC